MTDLTPLSPAALAVLCAATRRYAIDGDLQDSVAAALRAAAERIKPDLNRTPWLTNEDGYFNETFENMEALGEMNAYCKLLAIAAELEDAGDPT